jgi:hypothetical protein
MGRKDAAVFCQRQLRSALSPEYYASLQRAKNSTLAFFKAYFFDKAPLLRGGSP